MAIIDQSEIDALLSEADGLVAETAATSTADVPPPPPPPRTLKLPDDPSLQRVLRLRVPVIVQLARRMMSIEDIRKLAVGAIIEFEKSVEHELDLLVKNRQIGGGACVKVGENFGLRITKICKRAARIEALRGE